MNGKYDSNIDQYVPEDTSLTEVQQGYLSAVVDLYKDQKNVKAADVAPPMNKSTGAVSSAIKVLSSKGITEIDDQGNISLKNKGKRETQVSETVAEQGTEKAKKKTAQKAPVPESLNTECRKLGFTRTGTVITGYKPDKNIEEITIPDGATGIQGFGDLKKLKIIHLPPTIKSINGYAFHQCSSLEKVDFPSGAPHFESIGGHVFA